MHIDHVTIAGPDLNALRDSFAAAGLATDYGGPHSNGVTHMALLGFDDGSYIELISTIKPAGQTAPWWQAAIAGSSGSCGWAVRVSDVGAETKRLRSEGVTVVGPMHMTRDRPDGRVVQWDIAFPGEGGIAHAGATLPFFICDRTSRDWRVRPSASVAEAPLTGVQRVVIGVRDLDASVRLFRRLYLLSEPRVGDHEPWHARLAMFDDSPVVLASPRDAHSWLGRRLQEFGELPCAYLLATNNFDAARETYALNELHEWFGQRIAWFEPGALRGTRLGVV